ncbi:MAPEG family protein [Cognatilysobacter lacus]|nr:MAPEG family protein [Lysobacter lacus]
MAAHLIWWPAVAMAAITLLVWCRMFTARIGQMKRERIHPQRVANSAQAATLLTDSRAADNFRNLFELPVLFYAALAMAASLSLVDRATLGLAWAFVALRAVHSLVHCSYNRVIHRFWAYAAGGMVLWILWAYLVVGLLRA